MTNQYTGGISSSGPGRILRGAESQFVHSRCLNSRKCRFRSLSVTATAAVPALKNSSGGSDCDTLIAIARPWRRSPSNWSCLKTCQSSAGARYDSKVISFPGGPICARALQTLYPRMLCVVCSQVLSLLYVTKVSSLRQFATDSVRVGRRLKRGASSSANRRVNTKCVSGSRRIETPSRGSRTMRIERKREPSAVCCS
jgi:hypothetical protein